MARLHLRLLGGFVARLASGEACRLPTKKTRALVAYLALPAGRFHSRDKLTALLWGDTAESQARHSFRQALLTLRRALGDGHSPALLIQEDTVALNPEAVTVDAQAFEVALAAGSPDDLERAAALYAGHLLEGFGLDEAPFEEWRVLEGERLRELALEGLTRLLREHVRADRVEPAVHTAQQLLGMDPLQEAVHRALMRLFIRQGRRAAALRQYQACVDALARELATEPDEETRGLYREILRGGSRAVARPVRPVGSAPLAGDGRPPRAESSLVGRGAELATLHHALERALDVGAHVVIVSGEAGIGKTRLVQEFAGGPAPRQFRMLSASCHATEQPLPFRPWIDALRGEATTLDRDLPNRLGAASRRQLARVFPELSDGAPSSVTTNEHARLFEAMAELVESLAADEPTLIVLEDLHWADAMSVRLLAFLGRRLGALPVLIVGSARPEELIDAPALQQALTELRNAGRLDEIPLGGLTREESLTLARALRGSGRNPDVVDRIADDLWKLSEGNPLVIVESIRGLDPTGAGRPGLSPSIRDSVLRRLAHLPDRPRAALAAAAVIGQSFSFRLLHEVTGLDEMDAADAVEELVRRRVLDAVGERLDFYHDRIRQVVYEGLLPARRALLHRAVALALEAAHRDRLDDVADQLGQHFLRAGEAEKAIPYLLRVAELATRRYALDAASGALQQAMAATEQLSDLERDRCRLDIALRHGFVLTLLGRQREVLDLLGAHGACLKRVADPVLTFEYYFRLTLTHLYLGEHSRGLLVAEQALREGERSGDLERLGKALHLLSYAGYGVGDPQAGIVYATRALPLLDRPHLQHYLVLAYHDLFLNHVVAGTLDAALEAIERCGAIGRAVQDPRLEAYCGRAAWVHALRGDHDRAIESARRGLALSPEIVSVSLNRGFLGHAYLEQGDATSAIAALEPAVETVASIPITSAERRLLALLSEAQLLAGAVERARETAGRALALSRADGMPFNVGLAARALGRIARADGDLEAAERDLAAALEAFTECGACFEGARTRLDLARLRAEQGRGNVAREHLETAVGAFDVAGAPKRVAEARALARALGIDLEAQAGMNMGGGR